jgi:hypothetical protein
MNTKNAFKNTISKQHDYISIESRLNHAIALFGFQTIGLHLVEASLEGKLTSKMILDHQNPRQTSNQS